MSTEAAKNATSGKDSQAPVGDHSEDSQAAQDVPRSALGVVSESGEVLNEDGSAVGSITDSKDPKELVGKTVNSSGDILSSTGEVLGQAVIGGSDNENENTDSAYSLVGNSDKKDDDDEQHPLEAEKPQTKSETQFDGEDQDIPINLKNNDATDKAADASKEAEGAADDAKNTADDVKDKTEESEAPTEKAKGTAEDASEDVKDTAEDVKDKAETEAATEDVKDTAEDVKDKAETEAPSEEAKDTAEDVKDKAETEAPTEEAKGTAEDAAEGVKETADDTKDKVADNAEVPEADADKPVEDLKKDAPADEKDIPDKDAAEDKLPEGGEDKAGDDKEGEEEKKAEDTVAEGQEAAQDTAEDATDKTGEAADLAKGATGAAAETAEEKTDDAAETAEKKTDDAAETAEEKTDDAAETAEEKTDDAAETAEKKTDEVAEGAEDAKADVPETAEEKTDEAVEGAEGAKDEAAETAEEKTEEAGETAEEATDKVEEEAEKVDFSILKGTKVNKAGNLVNSNGDIIGRVVEGDAKKLLGKRADENGDIWDDAGKKVGKAEPLPDGDRENSKAFAPFENFPDATVEADGKVTSEGRQVGVVVEGDAKHLKGSKVDEDGDILDRRGNVVGKAEAWDEPEPVPEEPEAVVDKSALAGKRVNKLGNVVDGSGVIYGRVIEGNLQSMIGRMSDKEGNIRSESGDILGKAELVPEGEREGSKEGPFAELSGLTVSKDGKVVTPSGDVVGRLVSGDPKTLAGRSVDEDGEITDRNGNVLAKAERWEEPEPEPKKKDFLAGKKVNKEGNVTDEDGNIIGKLVAGELAICSGKEIDDDGDVVNSKGQTIGHASRLEDIPAEPEKEPEETPEEKAAREAEAEKKKLADNDNELARRLAYVIEETLGKMNPICEKITHKIEQEERKPKEERDEEELVKQVKPLIEEGGKILTETNGAIRGMDPDGRIQRNAKHKSGTKEATPEEHHLAEVLKELTGSVTKCIDGAKKKIDDMPHAKKELSPLWGLLADPLVQILAAVGLLLNGVLGLVGRLLNMLGLGGIVDGILGGLGINKLLTGLGLGDVVGNLTGKNKKDGKSKKGLFG